MSERMMGKIYYLPVPSRTYRYDYLLGMFTRGILQVGSGTFYGRIGVAYDIFPPFRKWRPDIHQILFIGMLLKRNRNKIN